MKHCEQVFVCFHEKYDNVIIVHLLKYKRTEKLQFVE